MYGDNSRTALLKIKQPAGEAIAVDMPVAVVNGQYPAESVKISFGANMSRMFLCKHLIKAPPVGKTGQGISYA
jgi:hypothetical protein